VAFADEGVDHPGEAEALAVFGGGDGHPGFAEPGDLLGGADASPTAVHHDVLGVQFSEQFDQVFEVFDVSALVGADRDSLDVFFEGGVYDLTHRPVVSQVDDFGSLRLQDAAHDVDRRVVPVEQAGRGDEPHGVGRTV